MLLSINPKVDFDYVYNVPDDPSCRHLLGITRTITVPAQYRSAAGMAGVLLIKGERPLQAPEQWRSEPAKGNEYVEVTLLQQIPYACFDDQKPPQIQKDSQGRFICNDGQVGVVEDLSPPFGAPGVWIGSGRYMLINGGKDTIFVKGDPQGNDPNLGVVIEYRTRYARYIGQFVLHCHILPTKT